MSEEIIKVLDAVCNKIGIAVDWSAENITPQIVDVITRYGHYLLANAIAGLAFGIILIPIAFMCTKKAAYIFVQCDRDSDSYWYDHDCMAQLVISCLGGAAVLCFIAGIVFIIDDIGAIIKCATIPDIYAAEQIIKMLQNGG